MEIRFGVPSFEAIPLNFFEHVASTRRDVYTIVFIYGYCEEPKAIFILLSIYDACGGLTIGLRMATLLICTFNPIESFFDAW